MWNISTARGRSVVGDGLAHAVAGGGHGVWVEALSDQIGADVPARSSDNF